ncbi:Gamma interferon inducible lysosomal thiol [Trichuris trichiura]|uniref:Gamma interferon inducible lysosomal thiol n=1 Tax=Trichuris trichiura TaxID=36087 RepID=A0A077Z864_TRITR|nr:Gamma interferon inducible lysosomal thiol [Trichuris trichiura]
MISLSFGCILLLFAQASADCHVPPSLWCDDEEIAKECGVSAACEDYNRTIFNEKINLTVLYETLCPDCQDFILLQLERFVWRFGREFVNFELVPYGNARKKNESGTWKIFCQHGPLECALNKLHSCAIHHLGDVERWLPFVVCMEKALKSHYSPQSASKLCMRKVDIKIAEAKKIMKCTTGDEGEELQLKMAERTETIKPDRHRFVPWILIQDVSTNGLQATQTNLFAFLCKWHRGNLPDGCHAYLEMLKQKQCAAV